MINGFFDVQFRLDELAQNGDSLLKMRDMIPWESFRPQLDGVYAGENRRGPAGRRPFDAVLMFKILVLQAMYNLSDAAAQFQILDRLSFMRFLGLDMDSRVPDAKTIWLFRERLNRIGLERALFDRFNSILREKGFEARKGQIVDATIVRVPVQHNTPDENRAVRRGDAPAARDGWGAAKARQKDTDARWTRKGGERYFGYKDHVEVDVAGKFIRDYRVTPASVHDIRVLEEVLDPSNSGRDVFADTAYRSAASVARLEGLGYRPRLQRRRGRRPLTAPERRGNAARAKTRSRVEHVFGWMWQKTGDTLLRCIGRLRAAAKLGLRNLAYNMGRYCFLAAARA
jgi:IS5 family transposase